MNPLPHLRLRPLRTAATMLTLLLFTAALSSCTIGDPTQDASAEPTAVDPASLVEPPPVRRASICFDWSRSVDVASRRDARESLARFIQAWPTEPTPGPNGASRGEAGLDLRIRKVMGGSTPTGSTGAEVVHIEIPSIPPVGEAADPESDDYDATDLAVRTQRQAATEASAEATRAVSQGVERVRAADYTASSSEIIGCLEAAARADDRAPLVLISDLAQADDNGRGLELSGRPSLRGRRILLVEACGTRGICGEDTPAWQDALEGAGAEAEVTAPEALDDDLTAFVTQAN